MSGRSRADVERDLAAIAAGRGRVATVAHPSCTCLPKVSADSPKRPADHGVTRSRRAACRPVHGAGRRGRGGRGD